MSVGELGTDLGPVTVTWTDTFHPYGVEVLDEPIEYRGTAGGEGPQRVGPDGDGMRAWSSCLGSPIRQAECEWERMRFGPTRRADGSVAGPAYTIDVPVAVRVAFPATTVWFVAGTPLWPGLGPSGPTRCAPCAGRDTARRTRRV
jgi:hypothetical protein